ncbi:cyclin-like protein [Chytriomyces cf. hyalinus JEL632]|nr:cyclin-like protein [Chytriomyces cf. hyalinus JEL632]
MPNSQSRSASQQWKYSHRDLQRPPSLQHGISLAEERELRSKAAKFISNMGYALKLPQLVIATAQTFMHRFYMRESFKKHQYHDVSSAAVFLATKVEETGRRLRAVITAAAQKAKKDDSHQVLEGSKEYRNWYDNMMYYEELLLAVLCWDLTVEYPYERILILCKAIGASQDQKDSAWALANDCYRSPFCLQYGPGEIAVACMMIGSKTQFSNTHPEMALTFNLEWPHFSRMCQDVDADTDIVLEIIIEILAFYERDQRTRQQASHSISHSKS